MIDFEIPTLNEGIDIDDEHRLISFNPYHEENVDISEEHNPEVSSLFPGIKTYSVFKRKRNGYGTDGNPLVYAFKKEKGWKFKSEMDKAMILEQFDKIVKKFGKMYPIGLTVLVPSGNLLNRRLAQRIKALNPNCEILDNFLIKLPVDDVREYTFFQGNESIYGIEDDNERKRVITSLKNVFNQMERERNGIFTYHLLPNHLRKYIYKTLELVDEYEYETAKKINGKNILILDDTISQGRTLSEVLSIIEEVFVPKSITILTLFK